MKKSICGVLALLWGTLCLWAAEGELAPPEGFVEVDLWSGVPPARPGGYMPKEKTSDPDQVSQVVRPRIWLRLPEKKPDAAPATCVLLVPGGSYGHVAMRHEGTEVANYLHSRGIASAVLLYRCKTQMYPAPLLDARKALSILHERAGEWGVDAGKIGVMGFSSGGHLAGLLCSAVETDPLSATEPRPAFAVFVYPVVRLTGDASHPESGANLLGKRNVETEAPKYALDALVDDKWPRSYGIHEKEDPVAPVAGMEALAASVRAKGIAMQLRIEDGKSHGFGWNRTAPPDNPGQTGDWLPKVTDWVLGGTLAVDPPPPETVEKVEVAPTEPEKKAETTTLVANLKAGKKQHIVAYGTTVTAQGAWVKQVGDALEKKYPGLVKITNSGGKGKDSSWGLENLQRGVIDLKPDTVIIEFAINDSMASSRIPLDQSKANLQTIIQRIRENLPACSIVLQVTNPVLGRSKGSAGYRPELNAYYQMYRDAAAANAVLLVDHAPDWAKVSEKGEDALYKLLPDGLQPNSGACSKIMTPNILVALGLEEVAGGSTGKAD